MNAAGITIIGASAGSGKTFRLTREVTQAIDPSAAARVPLEGLLAVTFTRKAHAELAGRIRQKLVESGAYDEAMRLPLAYVGTVHAACLRLLQEFALDAGLSPNVDVIGEDPSKLLRQALETSLPKELRERLDHLAEVTELRVDHKTHRVDWLTPVFDIMDLARSNRIRPDDLSAMADRSAVGLLELLPKPRSDERALDRELALRLDESLGALDRNHDGTKKTADVIRTIETAQRLLADGELPWSFWPKLAKIAPGVPCIPCVEGLRETAGKFEVHPRLHAEIHELTLATFEAARVGLAGYEEAKARRRVVDYVDMLDRTLDLLDDERVRDELGRRLELAVVDEFQDTSPIQLALFVRLHGLAKWSIWVGDRKQCIFEYAGADPTLMDAVAAWVSASGGNRDRLGGNYRSRTELVEACSELFATSLSHHGFRREEVTVTAERDPALPIESRATLAGLAPMGLWCLETAGADADADALAGGVARLLADPAATPVIDRATREARPLRAGDVAVLVATNKAAAAVAAQLHARGIRAALARAGLLGTPEGRLLDAALRWLLDEGDSLAAATVDALTGFGGKTADAWLEDQIRAARSSERLVAATAGWRSKLRALGPTLDILSPAEALDGVVDALDAVLLGARWPDAPQRIANLDALRALAGDYETRCEQEREAATVAGLLRYFDDLREETLRRGEPLASDDQHVPTDSGAVVVCTYHKSKGLEWPVVVLGTLDRAERRHAFEVAPESDEGAFDPERPLAGRWIRYWPWPFGGLEKVTLADAAAASPEGSSVAEREDRERARLLYVGFTRASDHLVLAVRVSKDKPRAAWLDSLTDAAGAPAIRLPVAAPDASTTPLRIRKEDGSFLDVPARVWRLQTAATETPKPPPETARWFARPLLTAASRPRYRIVPSDADIDWPELASAVLGASVGELERLPSAIPIEGTGYAYDVLGNAVHAFLAADVPGRSDEERCALAERLIVGASLRGVAKPESLVRASDELRAWVDRRWPGATWHCEMPIEATLATPDCERRASGIIDLLLETSDGLVIVDHKTFPGTSDVAVLAKAAAFLPQMTAYAVLLSRSGSVAVCGAFVHFPVGGAIVECRLPAITRTPGVSI